MEIATRRKNIAFFENYGAAFGIALVFLLLDLLSKAYIHTHLPLMGGAYPYGGIPIFHNFLGIEFSIGHATNHGAAWGVFANYETLLLGIRIALVSGLFLYFCFSKRHPLWRIPLALVIAGATGNIIDYFIYGHVVDMFHFIFWGYDYPVFNVADSAIFLGIASLVIISWFE